MPTIIEITQVFFTTTLTSPEELISTHSDCQTSQPSSLDFYSLFRQSGIMLDRLFY